MIAYRRPVKSAAEVASLDICTGQMAPPPARRRRDVDIRGIRGEFLVSACRLSSATCPLWHRFGALIGQSRRESTLFSENRAGRDNDFATSVPEEPVKHGTHLRTSHYFRPLFHRRDGQWPLLVTVAVFRGLILRSATPG